jgi:hypothetical protein
MYYRLDEENNVVPSTMEEWVMKLNWKRVDSTILFSIFHGSIHISTIFMGLDHGWFEGPPIVFYTMVFGGTTNGEQWRCSTWKQAERMHKEAVKEAREANRAKLLKFAVRPRKMIHRFTVLNPSICLTHY